MQKATNATTTQIADPERLSGGRQKNFADWAQVAANLAVILSVLIVVPIFPVQRRDIIALERQQLSAQMFEKKYEGRVLEALIKVGDAYDSNNELFPVFAGAQDEAKEALADKIIAEAGLDNIQIVVGYYNDLLVCMEQEVCDRSLAESLIDEDIRNFYCKARFAGLPQLRKRYAYARYGYRIARFSGSCDVPTQGSKP